MARQKRSILMFMDNCSAHVAGVRDLTLSNVKVAFLPPSYTSVTQPLDQGIIRSFKAQYRCRVVQKLIAAFNSDKLDLADPGFFFFFDLKDAALLTAVS